MEAVLFLMMTILAGFGLMAAGYKYSLGHKKTTGLSLAVVGSLMVFMSYASAIKWAVM